MPRLHVLAVRDAALQAFGAPFFVPAVGVGSRSFVDEVNNPESVFNKHPDDYELFELAVYDQESGVFNCLERPRSVLRGKDAVKNPAAKGVTS